MVAKWKDRPGRSLKSSTEAPSVGGLFVLDEPNTCDKAADAW